MARIRAAAARIRAAAAAAARMALGSRGPRELAGPPATLSNVLPFTPRPPRRVVGPWRPRIRPELRTIRERVIIYYAAADVPVAAALALAGWPVGGPW